MQYIKLQISILLIFLVSLKANAQRAEVGFVAGGAGYIGDLNQNDLLKISGFTAGVFAKMNFTPFVGLGLHYNYGNIKGDDLKSTNPQFRDRGLNFNTNLNEVSLIADVNFFDAFSPISKRRFTPYVFAGIGEKWLMQRLLASAMGLTCMACRRWATRRAIWSRVWRLVASRIWCSPGRPRLTGGAACPTLFRPPRRCTTIWAPLRIF